MWFFSVDLKDIFFLNCLYLYSSGKKATAENENFPSAMWFGMGIKARGFFYQFQFFKDNGSGQTRAAFLHAGPAAERPEKIPNFSQ